jgi:hypothetical protein
VTVPPERRIPDDTMNRPNVITRFFGGNPIAVVFRLILLSILVGFILKVLGLDPLDIIRSIENLVRTFWDMGFDAIIWLWRYFLLGAAIVVPIWFIVRLMRAPAGR